MKKAIVALSAIFLAAGLVSTGMAASDSEGSGVNVSISQTVEVDITPNSLEFIGNSPGTFNDTSNRGYNGVEVENIGSQNITNIWFDASNILDRPFGSGAAAEYNSANFLQIRPTAGVEGVVNPYPGGDSSDPQSGFHYVERKEFNESNELSYITPPSTSSGEEVRYGRFREGDEEFFWAIRFDDGSNSDANLCDQEGGTTDLFVGYNPHDRSQRGSTNFQDPSQYVQYDVSTDAEDYGQVNDVDLVTDHGNRTYSVLTFCGTGSADGIGTTNQTFTVRTRYNVEAGQHQASAQPSYSSPLADNAGSTPYKLMNSSSVNLDEYLQPGEHFTVETAISIPSGVSQGEVQSGDLTLKVNNN